ncbi:hypothetical protein E4T42_07700 [Aureobasidium subglaciale]|nr:hypothetical protein E4T42_07700 [Aureobasidium subglaciale]
MASEAPFDPSTFDPESIDEALREAWRRNPSLTVPDENDIDETTATSAKEYYRRWIRIPVSPAVMALGKNPYHGLRVRRYIPELNRWTPAYDDRYPWMNNKISQYVAHQELLQLGCINIEPGASIDADVSPQFKVDTATLAMASKNRSVSSNIGSNAGIHPCFQRSNWKDTSDAEMEFLKPVLRVATQMMAMDSVLDVWYALGQPLLTPPPTRMLVAQKKPFRVFYTGQSTREQRAKTARESMGLRDFVTFHWKAEPDEPGSTLADVNKKGLRGGTNTYDNDEKSMDLKTGADTMLPGMHASHYNPDASDQSAALRTQFHLATVLVHELTHAWFENVTSEHGQIYVFRNDDRIGEEGYAVETVISNGVILDELAANVSVYTMPFGMSAKRWPGIHKDGSGTTKATASKYGLKFNTEYAVPMTSSFWDQRTIRFGSGALNNFRSVGVRMTVDEVYDESESPAVKKKYDSSGVWKDEPEIDPDVTFPDEDEGIVYIDKILDLLGQPIKDEMDEDDEYDEDEEMT